jgi:glycosyltransferase involved in cell wall biosynthesis
MRHLTLGIIFDQTLHAGGGYQQALNAVNLSKNLKSEFVDLVYFTTHTENIEILYNLNINIIYLHLNIFHRTINFIRRRLTKTRLIHLIKKVQKYNSFEKILIKYKVDLVYFVSPSVLSVNLEYINYITTVWDLCHREDPEFPEVRYNREFEKRDILYKSILPRATAVLVDSEQGKLNVSNWYCIDAERIFVMPFEASISIRNHQSSFIDKEPINIGIKYDLKFPYIFYPAQFWAHKNHVYILEGLSLLDKIYGIKIGAIFSGVDKGNLKYVKSVTTKLMLDDLIRFIGFVPDEEIAELYLQSIALVMPTYFGPTNLPPIEAFSLGVPVLYPNKKGLIEQVGDAALIVDLTDPKSLADKLKVLIEDEDLRTSLIKSGFIRFKQIESNNRVKILSLILKKFRSKRACWE